MKMANSEVSLEQQEQILEDNRDFIVKRLDTDEVIDELIQANLIGQNAAQRVQLMGTSRVEKNRIIFDQLITCGPRALDKFCEILKSKKRQSFIAERLEKCKANYRVCLAGESLANLVNNQPFAKLKPSKLVFTICYRFPKLLQHQVLNGNRVINSLNH